MAIEDNGDIIETAGVWTIGVAHALMISFIPDLIFSVGVGFALRLSKKGMKMGSD